MQMCVCVCVNKNTIHVCNDASVSVCKATKNDMKIDRDFGLTDIRALHRTMRTMVLHAENHAEYGGVENIGERVNGCVSWSVSN